MARNLFADQLVQEDYIDMDINSSTAFLCYSISPSPNHFKEFEFQMIPNLTEKESIASPADDLFYNGKLLPLQLPHPLHNPPNPRSPFESCNVSPSTSCCVSQELNPQDFFFFFNQSDQASNRSTKTWSSFGLKLKASKAFLMSLFTKPTTCSHDSCAVLKATPHKKKRPFGLIIPNRTNRHLHRRSLSDAGKRKHYLPSKTFSFSSSSSSSSSSTASNSSSFSSTKNSEVDNSIQEAIAHCKKSHQQSDCGRKTESVCL